MNLNFENSMIGTYKGTLNKIIKNQTILTGDRYVGRQVYSLQCYITINAGNIKFNVKKKPISEL